MKELLPYILFFFIVALAITYLYIATRKNSQRAHEKWEKEETEPEISLENGELTKKEKPIEAEGPEDGFVFVLYRGIVLSMRKFEKREYWDKYNRVERNEHIEGVKKALKRGEVKKEWLDADKTLCMYVPVKGNYKKILNDYNEFKSLGGELKEE